MKLYVMKQDYEMLNELIKFLKFRPRLKERFLKFIRYKWFNNQTVKIEEIYESAIHDILNAFLRNKFNLEISGEWITPDKYYMFVEDKNQFYDYNELEKLSIKDIEYKNYSKAFLMTFKQIIFYLETQGKQVC